MAPRESPSIRTFLDANILIYAHRGEEPRRAKAFGVLSGPEPGDDDASEVIPHTARVFLTSQFLYLETVPKAVFQQNELEVAFYRQFFDDPKVEWIRDLDGIYNLAKTWAETYGLAAMDALHVAAAKLGKADEFITGDQKLIRSLRKAQIVPVVDLDELR